MQKYATRGHDDIETASKNGNVPNPQVDRKRRREKAAIVAKRNAGLARCRRFLVERRGDEYKMVE
jgi:hypothetical protein